MHTIEIFYYFFSPRLKQCLQIAKRIRSVFFVYRASVKSVQLSPPVFLPALLLRNATRA